MANRSLIFRRWPDAFWTLCLLVMAVAAGGCSREPRTYLVKGRVTFDGQPVARGDLLFLAPAGDRGPDASQINDGAYELKTTEGKKRVEISASKIRPGGAKGAGGEPVPEEYIPERYNVQSGLTADVQASDANTFDFDLRGTK